MYTKDEMQKQRQVWLSVKRSPWRELKGKTSWRASKGSCSGFNIEKCFAVGGLSHIHTHTHKLHPEWTSTHDKIVHSCRSSWRDTSRTHRKPQEELKRFDATMCRRPRCKRFAEWQWTVLNPPMSLYWSR